MMSTAAGSVMMLRDRDAAGPRRRARQASSLLRAISWGLLFAFTSSAVRGSHAQQLVGLPIASGGGAPPFVAATPAVLAVPPVAAIGAAGQGLNATSFVKLIREACKTVRFTAADVVRR